MGDHDHEVCNTRLGLGIGLDDFVPKRDQQQQQQKKSNKRVICLDLSFPFHFKDDHHQEIMDIGYKTEGSSSKTINGEDQERQSTTSNNMNDDHTDDNNKNNNIGGVRKKLRLTKEQSIVLEDSFRQHTTLNTAQKQTLADKLNLKPRQVEVWFQNRRARTKLKQTEIDCEFLKKCCKNLSDENRRLKKELQELQSSFKNTYKSTTTTSTTPSFFVQLEKAAAAATVSMCPSCQKMVRSKGSCGGDIVKHERSMAAAAADAVVHKPKH